MTEPTWVTVAELVVLTGKSKTVLYRLIEARIIRSEQSSAGMLVNLAQARRVLANRRGPGRPKRAA